MGKDLLIHVYTGDRKNAGTDSNVQIILYDENKSSSPPISLDNYFKNDFERGNMDTFVVSPELVSSLQPPVRISRIELLTDNSGLGSHWFVDKIEVENRATNERFIFPVFRWIKPNVRVNIKHLDTSLPQFDEFPDQRRKGLEDKLANYLLTQRVPNGPVQAKNLPSDEAFSFDYQWDIMSRIASFKLRTKVQVTLHSDEFCSMEEMLSAYDNETFQVPQDTEKWNDDARFGMQRVASLNHSLISLVKEIPAKFPVTDSLLEPFLEGSTIQEAINKKRLIICDLGLLKELQCKDNFVVCAPICLLYLDTANHLKPVAIQLQQVPGPNNPIFTPSCQTLTWGLVKLWFNNADTAYHQSLTHLGFTHVLMEGVTLTTHRHLSVSHPIFKILAPHFLYILAINDRAFTKLVAPGGWVDQIMNCAAKGMFEIIIRGFNNWRMDVEGTLPEDLKNRGLDDPNVLPIYHYRDDALLLYKAINKYVKSYVDLYYTSPEILEKDHEIQSWAQELVMERAGSDGGLGIRGVPGNGHISTNDQLTLIVTSIIYACSVGHAAANFPQYEEYGYPPKYPAMMRGKPPTDPNAHTTEQDILKCLPNRENMLKSMSLTKVLSSKGTKSLGDFEVQYVFDPDAMKLIHIFRKDLAEISKVIAERNKQRETPYEYLDPKFIPNSISI